MVVSPEMRSEMDNELAVAIEHFSGVSSEAIRHSLWDEDMRNLSMDGPWPQAEEKNGG